MLAGDLPVNQVNGKRSYREWPERAQQRLLDLIAIQPLPDVAIAMRRSPGSIRSMLHRLGASARMGQDWFTKYTLAERCTFAPMKFSDGSRSVG